MEINVPRTVVTDGPSTLSPGRRTQTRTVQETKSILKTDRMEIAFVECNTTNLVDGETYASEVFVDGTYSYANTLGARRTIPAFTTNALKIARKIQKPSKP